VKLVFATQNKHKQEEVRYLLDHAIEIISLSDLDFFEELPETHLSLEKNAEEKTDFVFRHLHENCFGEDTGLEIEALNGAPGILSARYAGEKKNAKDNIWLVLMQMSDMKNFNAKFRTVICLILEGKKYFFEGEVNGIISQEPRGTSGFGYDPIFIPEGFDQTFAEMDFTTKNKISHRKKAFFKMNNFLQEELKL